MRCLRAIGYNSHGVYASLGEIKELETERGNEDVVNVIEAFLEQYPNKKESASIWVMRDAFQCFKQYYLASDFFNRNDDLIQDLFPFWESVIYQIDLQDMQFICEDGDGGYLYCCKSIE